MGGAAQPYNPGRVLKGYRCRVGTLLGAAILGAGLGRGGTRNGRERVPSGRDIPGGAPVAVLESMFVVMITIMVMIVDVLTARRRVWGVRGNQRTASVKRFFAREMTQQADPVAWRIFSFSSGSVRITSETSA